MLQLEIRCTLNRVGGLQIETVFRKLPEAHHRSAEDFGLGLVGAGQTGLTGLDYWFLVVEGAGHSGPLVGGGLFVMVVVGAGP